MRKLFLCAALLAASLLASLQAPALELDQLKLPMTRDEADASLGKDYSYRVLQDLTIRRTWKLKDRTVTVDFSARDDKAVYIGIAYDKPVTKALASRDVATMLGGKPGEWRDIKKKMAATLGMKKADGMKLDDGSYIFRELKSRGKVSRIDHFAKGATRENRMELPDYDTKGAVTALGTRAGAGNIDYILKDEAQRKATAAPAKPAKKPVDTPAVVTPEPEPEPVVAVDEAEEDILEPEVEQSGTDKALAFLSELDPLYYGIGAGVLALLVLLRIVLVRRAARKRAALAAAIINGGKPKAADAGQE